MNLRQLRYFLAVVDNGGVHRAAEVLFVAQPSISQALRSLEQDLGTTLFHRTGRRLVLTPAGEALIPAAREVMHGVKLARSMVDAVDGLRSGRLVISSTPSQAASPLAPLVGRFLELYPGVQIMVRAAPHRDDVVSALRVGEAELGLIAHPVTEATPATPAAPVTPATSAASAAPAAPAAPVTPAAPAELAALADLVFQPVEVQHYLCVARDPGAIPAGSDPLRPEELAGARLIVGQPGTGVRRAADLVLAAAEGSRVVVEIESREALLPLVLAGAGVAVVAEGFRSAAEAAGLSVRDLDVPEALAVDLMHRRGPISPAAQAFLAVAAARAES